jgi:hypothetical protein
MKLVRVLACSGVFALVWTALSCAPSGFANQSLIASVRILASSADKPYAKPGDSVTVQVLAFDGRPTKPEPMNLWWLPFQCENPTDDAYYACFAKFGAAVRTDAGASASADAGAGGIAGQPGVDLTAILTAGPSMKVTLATDIITSHPPVAGAQPYGLVILFNFACAGHLEFVPPDPSNPNPQQIPIGCFDSQHNALGPDDFVFGFTRIYASENVTDANPVITQVDVPGGPLAVQNGTTAAFATAACSGADGGDCANIPIGPIIQPPQPGREVWAVFYSTAGSFTSDARLLYETTGSAGSPAATDDAFVAPGTPGAQLIWIVVHDDHNGASWVTVPVALQ